MSVGVKVVLLVEDDTMVKHLYPYIQSRTLKVYVYVHYGYGLINKEINFYITKNSTSFSTFGSIFERFLGTDVGLCEGRTLGQG